MCLGCSLCFSFLNTTRPFLFRRYALDAGEVVTNSTVQELAAVHPNLLRLDVTNCKMISDVGMWALAR